MVAPRSIKEIGVRRKLLEDLALKSLYTVGEISLSELARHMGLGFRNVEELFERLRKDQLCEVTGMDGNVHRITTSTAGKSRAMELLMQNQYTGPAPVSLKDYVSRIHAQSVRDIEITPDDMKRAFAELVLSTEMLNQLGTAVVSGQALFLYGPTGTGKTIIAQTLGRLFEDDLIWLPYAVEVDGQIITVYDPILHQRVDQPDQFGHDPRWVMCRRPRITVAGELTMEMLDLQLNPNTRFYSGPAQMKANNGLLIVDDFGRQRVKPAELLNRWVVPLERRVDSLTLIGGRKIEIPFDLLVVFSTNLDPAETMEDAFLRRIQTKIEIGFVTPDEFHEIFRRVCRQFNLMYERSLVDGLIDRIQREYGEPLRACQPRDIIQQVLWAARYLKSVPNLNRESILHGCRNYFVTTRRSTVEMPG